MGKHLRGLGLSAWLLVLAAVIAGCAAAPIRLAGRASASEPRPFLPRCPPGAKCPATVPTVTFTPTINGRTGRLRPSNHAPHYQVSPGEDLMISVMVTVPAHVAITALWFGVSTGTWGIGPAGPIGMNPILAHYIPSLSAGSHGFSFRWRVPATRSIGSLYLTYAWSSRQPPAAVSGAFARLAAARSPVQPDRAAASYDCAAAGRELGAWSGDQAVWIREIVNPRRSGIVPLDAAMHNLARSWHTSAANHAFTEVIRACSNLKLWHTYR